MSTPGESRMALFRAELKALEDKFKADKQAHFTEFDEGCKLRQADFDLKQETERRAFAASEQEILEASDVKEQAIAAAHIDACTACEDLFLQEIHAIMRQQVLEDMQD